MLFVSVKGEDNVMWEGSECNIVLNMDRAGLTLATFWFVLTHTQKLMFMPSFCTVKGGSVTWDIGLADLKYQELKLIEMYLFILNLGWCCHCALGCHQGSLRPTFLPSYYSRIPRIFFPFTWSE